MYLLVVWIGVLVLVNYVRRLDVCVTPVICFVIICIV